MNGQYVDVHIFGLLYHEHRILRRQRRGRRPKPNGLQNLASTRIEHARRPLQSSPSRNVTPRNTPSNFGDRPPTGE
jgi:hypothetical protein